MAVKTTQRAYTLRLTGTDRNDQTWRENLWRTHEAVNKGAKAFGDWLLTLRGGLSHELAEPEADAKLPKGYTRDDLRRDRRILLALSWLSVESEAGAPEKHIIARASDPKRKEKVVAALCAILQRRGLRKADVDAWEATCRDSLSAAIREDAVWVNRRESFDDIADNWNGLTDDDALMTLSGFFGEAAEYLCLPEGDSESAGADGEHFSNLARAWLSSNWGSGAKSNKTQIADTLNVLAKADLTRLVGRPGTELAAALVGLLGGALEDGLDPKEALRLQIGWSTGRSSKGRMAIDKASAASVLSAEDISRLQMKLGKEAEEKRGRAGATVPNWSADLRRSVETTTGLPFRPSRDLTGEYSTILDHAARRVSQTHSWVKLAEARRRKYTSESSKLVDLEQVAGDACAWLAQFSQERSMESGAIVGYRIRRRAISAWAEIVKAWTKKDCKTEADRVQAARDVEADPEIDKFGDIQLFEALAADDAKCVWQRNGEPDSEILKTYVHAKDAEDRMRRYKVPAYRHPDPFLHPVFCDFGCSRWAISFGIHEAARRVRKLKEDLAMLDTSSDVMVEAKRLRVKKAIAGAQDELAKPDVLHGVEMGLCVGAEVAPSLLRWQSKRLPGDLALPDTGNEPVAWLSRADRLGRAARPASARDAAGIIGLIEQKQWNGRLQAPRGQLEAIARCEDPLRRKHLLTRLEWLVTLSAELQPQGPWCDYAKQRGIKSDELAPRRDRDSWRGLAYPFWHPANEKGRQGHAKHVLSCLPGLRVLSVDLGHRFAAACAVWETLDARTVLAACKKVGHLAPIDSDMYLHLRLPADVDKSYRHGKDRGKLRKVEVYRRIGPDMWARLDRQFAIKLQGEEEALFEKIDPKSGKRIRDAARRASPDENAQMQEFETWLGFQPRPDDDPRPDAVKLVSRAVRLARLGLRRHGDRARIAFYLDPKYKPERGGKTALSEEARKELLEDALMLWQGLFSRPRWQDVRAREAWQLHVRAKLPPAPVEDASRAELKAYDKKVRELLPDYAAKLATDATLREELHRLWSARWREDDGEFGVTAEVNTSRKLAGLPPLPLREATGWYRQLRNLTDWILPRGNPKSDASIRHVGGVSLDRLSNISELYQLMKAHKTRPEPEDVRKNVQEKGDSRLDRYGQRVLDAREHMRENRVKQLSSRIVEAALGIGKEQPRVNGRESKRPRERVYPACHAVVIENLDNYRPDELQTRRENRALMQWSSGKVRDYLAESCQLYGLHLRMVQPNYTSRQDSRTGVPGIRCEDKKGTEFKTWFEPRQSKLDKELREKKNSKKPKDIARVAELEYYWLAYQQSLKGATSIRIPRKGGDIFVPADPRSPAAKGLQADLNAAANIGLKALLDPDWPGKWWYVPCDAKTHVPVPEKVKGGAADIPDALAPVAAGDDVGTKRKRKVTSGNDITNFWRDPSAETIGQGDWMETPKYWGRVKEQVIRILLGQLADSELAGIPYKPRQ